MRQKTKDKGLSFERVRALFFCVLFLAKSSSKVKEVVSYNSFNSPLKSTHIYLFPWREKMIQKGLEKEEREKEITFPQKVFLSRINILSLFFP